MQAIHASISIVSDMTIDQQVVRWFKVLAALLKASASLMKLASSSHQAVFGQRLSYSPPLIEANVPDFSCRRASKFSKSDYINPKGMMCGSLNEVPPYAHARLSSCRKLHMKCVHCRPLPASEVCKVVYMSVLD